MTTPIPTGDQIREIGGALKDVVKGTNTMQKEECAMLKSDRILLMGMFQAFLVVAFAILALLAAGSPSKMTEMRPAISGASIGLGLLWFLVVGFAFYKYKLTASTSGKVSAVIQMLGALVITAMGFALLSPDVQFIQ